MRAHIHAIWLAQTGLSFTQDQGSILNIVDAEQPDLALHQAIVEQAVLPEHKRQACHNECVRVI